LLTTLFVDRFVHDHENIHDPDVRLAYGMLEAWTSIVLNIVLACGMFATGLMLNSIALTANAAHTAADVITSIAVFVGFRAARIPADESHPYGHGRAEDIATLMIAMLLMLVGYEFFTKSVGRLMNPEPVAGSVYAVVGLIGAAGVKEWLARFSVGLGRKISSSALEADAWHHRSDAISMVLVAVGMVATKMGYVTVDALLGAGVSCLIAYTGYRLASGTVSKLLGEKAPGDLVKRVEEVTRNVEGVIDTHKLEVHIYGGNAKASIHIQVDPTLPVSESHEIAARVKYRLADETSVDATVHVEPHLG
jgi:cation diffusion facilitator family transporter